MNRDGTNVIMALGAMIAIAAGALFYFVYFYSAQPSVQSDTALAELATLYPSQHTLDVVGAAECKTVRKYPDYWFVMDCKDDAYFKIEMSGGGYMMLYCANGQTLKERFVTVADYLGKSCTNQSDTGTFLKNYGSDQLYAVCGYEVIVRGNCLVGVS